MYSIDDAVDRAIHSLEMAGHSDYIGEPVSQLDHALQSAYFAEQSGHGEDVVLASLFHDIGHFASDTMQFKMADLGVTRHEWIGAKLAFDFGFSKKIALLIGYHVDAKRYLAGKKSNYYERLSFASRRTLSFQGGPMTEQEMKLFEAHPYFKEILQVRINDEKGKETNLTVPGIDHYRLRIKDHLEQNHKQAIESDVNHLCTLTDFIDGGWVEKLKNFLEIQPLNFAVSIS